MGWLGILTKVLPAGRNSTPPGNLGPQTYPKATLASQRDVDRNPVGSQPCGLRKKAEWLPHSSETVVMGVPSFREAKNSWTAIAQPSHE